MKGLRSGALRQIGQPHFLSKAGGSSVNRIYPNKLQARRKAGQPSSSGRWAEIMKTLMFLSCLVPAIAPANAQTYSARQLDQYCHSNRALVAGYVAGILDKAEFDSMVLIEFYLQTYDASRTAERIEKEKSKIIESFDAIDVCHSTETPIEQKVELLCKFVEGNPDQRRETPAELLKLALKAESTCK